jgi:protein SCO1
MSKPRNTHSTARVGRVARVTLAALIFCAAITTTSAVAQPMMPAGGPGGAPQALAPDTVIRDVGVDQNLDAVLAADLTFKNEAGQTVRLGDYYGKRPLILSLVYYECPGLCTMTLNGVARALNALRFTPGKEYDLLVVSFDPRETPELAAAKKAKYVKEFNRHDGQAGWHFLTGDQPNIDALCKTVGFRYRYDEKSKQYAHASAIMVITPQGHVSRYFYGLEYSTKDIELGLMEASQNRIGTLSDAVMLFCFQYDPASGKYSLAVMRLLRVAALATVATLGTFMFVMFRRDRRNKLRTAECGLRSAEDGTALPNPQSEIRNPQ